MCRRWRSPKLQVRTTPSRPRCPCNRSRWWPPRCRFHLAIQRSLHLSPRGSSRRSHPLWPHWPPRCRRRHSRGSRPWRWPKKWGESQCARPPRRHSPWCPGCRWRRCRCLRSSRQRRSPRRPRRRCPRRFVRCRRSASPTRVRHLWPTRRWPFRQNLHTQEKKFLRVQTARGTRWPPCGWCSPLWAKKCV